MNFPYSFEEKIYVSRRLFSFSIADKVAFN